MLEIFSCLIMFESTTCTKRYKEASQNSCPYISRPEASSRLVSLWNCAHLLQNHLLMVWIEISSISIISPLCSHGLWIALSFAFLCFPFSFVLLYNAVHHSPDAILHPRDDHTSQLAKLMSLFPLHKNQGCF